MFGFQFQQHFQDISCGFTSEVCCTNNMISEQDHCPEGKKSNCGRRFSASLRIAGGNDTDPGDWPWMARLLYNKTDEAEGTTHCGGTLITGRHVVTAAHCIKEDYTPVAVALGDSDVTTEYDCFDAKSGRGCSTSGKVCADEGECAPNHVEVTIKNIAIHKEYDNGSIPQFDVALIVLDRQVVFTHFIQPACLPILNQPSEGPLTITGWGNTIGGWQKGKSASILQELNVKEVPLSECKTLWTRWGERFLPSHLCATTDVSGKASCGGDSGGPLVRYSNLPKFPEIWELAGVVSFGKRVCGNVNAPLGFSRIGGEINSWLQEIIGSELPTHT